MESIKERKSCSEEGGSELEVVVNGPPRIPTGIQPDNNNNNVKGITQLDLSSSDSKQEINDDVDENYSTNLVHNFQVVSFFMLHIWLLCYTFDCYVIHLIVMLYNLDKYKIYLIPSNSQFFKMCN